MLEPFSRVLFLEAAKGLNKRSSARFAARQARLGRPVPKGPHDPRPDPGTVEGDEAEG